MASIIVLVAVCLVIFLVLVALLRKGDVRAVLKLPFISFAIDTKEKAVDIAKWDRHKRLGE
jgi:hypothetical protein